MNTDINISNITIFVFRSESISFIICIILGFEKIEAKILMNNKVMQSMYRKVSKEKDFYYELLIFN